MSEQNESKVYRASLLGYLLAVATDGDEGELDEVRPTTLRISRIGESDAAGRIQMLDFFAETLFDAVHAAQDAGLSFESLAISEPCGKVSRIYIQPHALTQAAAESDEAISFHATLGNSGVLSIHQPFDDDDDDDTYLRIMEVRYGGRDDSFLVAAEHIHACIDAVKRNFLVSRVMFDQPAGHQRAKQSTPWRISKPS